jgi:hypothetical protein
MYALLLVPSAPGCVLECKMCVNSWREKARNCGHTHASSRNAHRRTHTHTHTCAASIFLIPQAEHPHALAIEFLSHIAFLASCSLCIACARVRSSLASTTVQACRGFLLAPLITLALCPFPSLPIHLRHVFCLGTQCQRAVLLAPLLVSIVFGCCALHFPFGCCALLVWASRAGVALLC